MSTMDKKIHTPNRVAPSATRDFWKQQTKTIIITMQKYQKIDKSRSQVAAVATRGFEQINHKIIRRLMKICPTIDNQETVVGDASVPYKKKHQK